MPRGRKTSFFISLNPQIQRELESWQRATCIPAGLARRGQIILLLAAGTPVSQVARSVGMERCHVYKWVKRFLERDLEGLRDKPGRGRKPAPAALAEGE